MGTAGLVLDTLVEPLRDLLAGFVMTRRLPPRLESRSLDSAVTTGPKSLITWSHRFRLQLRRLGAPRNLDPSALLRVSRLGRQPQPRADIGAGEVVGKQIGQPVQ